MKVFEEACRLSCEEWAATLPDSPEYTLSKKAEKRLRKIIFDYAGIKKRRVSKRAARIIAIAAIVSALLIATTAFAVMSQSDFDILGRADMSEYAVADANGQALSSDLQVSYVVDGFELSETEYSDNAITALNYISENGDFYSVRKLTSDKVFTFDTEDYQCENTERNGIIYTCYKSNSNKNGLVWNYGGYIYCISGNISLDDAFDIAESIDY